MTEFYQAQTPSLLTFSDATKLLVGVFVHLEWICNQLYI